MPKTRNRLAVPYRVRWQCACVAHARSVDTKGSSLAQITKVIVEALLRC